MDNIHATSNFYADDIYEDDGWTSHGIRKPKKTGKKGHHRDKTKKHKTPKLPVDDEAPKLDIAKLRGTSGITKCSFPDGRPMKGAIGQRCMCYHCVSLRRDS